MVSCICRWFKFWVYDKFFVVIITTKSSERRQFNVKPCILDVKVFVNTYKNSFVHSADKTHKVYELVDKTKSAKVAGIHQGRPPEDGSVRDIANWIDADYIDYQQNLINPLF